VASILVDARGSHTGRFSNIPSHFTFNTPPLTGLTVSSLDGFVDPSTGIRVEVTLRRVPGGSDHRIRIINVFLLCVYRSSGFWAHGQLCGALQDKV